MTADRPTTEAPNSPSLSGAVLPATGGRSGAPAAAPFVLAHLSDPHLPMRLGVRQHRLFNKRFFGYLTWRFRRVRVHRREVLDALCRDLLHHRPDHVVVTGDIVNISLPHEFSRAGEWLHNLGAAEDVTVVPGNHDAYVAVSWEESWAAWREFMSSDGSAPPGRAVGQDVFPVFRKRGPVAVIGLSTAVPTAPGVASGRVGKAQLERLARRLRAAEEAGLFRVVLLHHPPFAPKAPLHKQLTDADGFVAVIAEAGAELILHGHEHRFRREELTGPSGPVPVFGVPSASMLPQGNGRGAQYHLHQIERTDLGWSVSTQVHAYDPDLGRFTEHARLQATFGKAIAGSFPSPT